MRAELDASGPASSPGRRGLLKSALLAAAASVPVAAGLVGEAAAADEQVASSRMSYSRFLEYLDMGRVKKVSDRGRTGGRGILSKVGPGRAVGFFPPMILSR